jgi:hypothetical protein
MWRNILVQSFYQLLVCCLLFFWGPHYFGVSFGKECLEYNIDDHHMCDRYDNTHHSFVFNVFVFVTVFNEFNARSIGNTGLDVVKTAGSNYMFVRIMSITTIVQLIFLEGFSGTGLTVGLSGTLWGYTLLFGLLSIPMGVLMRKLPPMVEEETVYAGYPEMSPTWRRQNDRGLTVDENRVRARKEMAKYGMSVLPAAGEEEVGGGGKEAGGDEADYVVATPEGDSVDYV